jgi:hypothetical protein
MPPKRRTEDDNNDNQSFKQSRIDGVSIGGADGSDGDEPGGSGDIAIPIFLQKTYRMIESCDPSMCSWTEDGEMFVVKAPVRVRFYHLRLGSRLNIKEGIFCFLASVVRRIVLPYFCSHSCTVGITILSYPSSHPK